MASKKIISVLSVLLFVAAGCSKEAPPSALTLVDVKGKKAVDLSVREFRSAGSLETDNGKPVLIAKRGESGLIIFGPYWPLSAGRYKVTYSLSVSGKRHTVGAVADYVVIDRLTNTPTVEEKREISSTKLDDLQDIAIEFTAPKNDKGYLVYEFRVSSTGSGAVRIHGITLEKLI